MSNGLTQNGAVMEKDFSNHNGSGVNGGRKYHLDDMNMGNEEALNRIQTAGSISISPELFEKIYLSPQNAVKGDLRKTFGNPTPLALVGFLLCNAPLSCDLMGWRGAGGNGAASIGVYYFFGGVLMVLSGFLEFILGNTFPFVVFSSFGAFWLSLGATLQPFYYAYGSYAPAGSTSEAAGLATVGFTASFGFFILFMAVLCFIFLICSLRTNITFAIIFFSMFIALCLFTASYWHVAQALAGKTSSAVTAHRLQVGAGACAFAASMAAWYCFLAIMLAVLDFPIQLPVGDLSTYIKGKSERMKMKAERENIV